jgi:hypothetical protein
MDIGKCYRLDRVAQGQSRARRSAFGVRRSGVSGAQGRGGEDAASAGEEHGCAPLRSLVLYFTGLDEVDEIGYGGTFSRYSNCPTVCT